MSGPRPANYDQLVLDEEAPHAPRLVGQRMHQLKATPQAIGMDGADIGDLDGELRDDCRRGILAQDADLGGRVARRHKRHDPAHYRALFGHAPTSGAEIERAVETLLQGIATDYPRLLEHSRRMRGDPKLHRLHA
jgi:hypothetical protein